MLRIWIIFKRVLTSFIIVSFFAPLSGQTNTAPNTYMLNLMKEISETNRYLPIQEKEGLWIWSAKLEDHTVVVTIKANSYYSLYAHKMDRMNDVYAKFIIKNFGNEVPLMVKNKISLKLRFVSYEDDDKLYELSLTPSQISKIYKELSNFGNWKGTKPLSYYQKGFIVQNSELPEQIDEYTTQFKISMPGNIVYYDYYLEDSLTDLIVNNQEIQKEFCNEFRKKMGSGMKVMCLKASDSFIEDILLYEIKFCCRYYYKSSKKYAFEIVIDPKYDF